MLKAKIRFLAGVLALFFTAQLYGKPMVLSSIKPLTLIAQEITGELADTATLLPITASPHDYPLKVSDYGKLQKADLMLWVGPELESFLQKPLANLPANKIITAYDLSELNWPEENHSSEESHQGHHHERDPHIWLDPRNAIVVARVVALKLAQIDKPNEHQYKENLRVFILHMEQLDKTLAKELESLKGLGFAVYHEGYGHFVSHYGLHQINYVTYTPEQRPGAKHLDQLRKDLAANGKCLFLEPYSESRSAQDLAKELHLKTGVLDALGTQNVDTYAQLLERMAASFLTCLTNGRR